MCPQVEAESRLGSLHLASMISSSRQTALCREAWAGPSPGDIQGCCRDCHGLCWVTLSDHLSAVSQFPNLYPKANLGYQQCRQ